MARPSRRARSRPTESPRTPSASTRRDRALIVAAGVALVICVALTAATVHWRRQASTSERATAQAQSSTIGAQAASARFAITIDELSTRTAELKRLVDVETVQLDDAVTGRDLVRSAVIITQQNLITLQSQLEGTFALVLAQGDTLAQLDACLDGVGKALNLVALHNDAAASEALFSSNAACQQSQAAVDAARRAG